MTRLFTFGCSFTRYWRWPTWADALGREYDCHENWGVCGAGNSLIFNSLIECHQRNRITSGDTVRIMWTNTSREDRYVGHQWLAQGNIYWTAGSDIPMEYITKFACERGYLIRDLALITAAKHLLESWCCDFKFLSMVPLQHTNLDNDLGHNPSDLIDQDQDVRDLYRSTLDSILPSVYEVLFGRDWFSRPGIPDTNDTNRRDFHPSPLEHLEYLDRILPGAIQSQQTRTWMEDWENHARLGDKVWEFHSPDISRL